MKAQISLQIIQSLNSPQSGNDPQVQQVIDNYTNQLYQWMLTHVNEQPTSKLQADYAAERALLDQELGAAIDKLAAQGGVSWSTINQMNPWGVYSSYADELQNDSINPQYSGQSPTIPAPSGGGGSGWLQKIDAEYQKEESAYKALSTEYDTLTAQYNEARLDYQNASPADKAKYKDLMNSITNSMNQIKTQMETYASAEAALTALYNEAQTETDPAKLQQDYQNILNGPIAKAIANHDFDSLEATFNTLGQQVSQLDAAVNPAKELAKIQQEAQDEYNAAIQAIESQLNSASTNYSAAYASYQAALNAYNTYSGPNKDQVKKDLDGALAALNLANQKLQSLQPQFLALKTAGEAALAKVMSDTNVAQAEADLKGSEQADAAIGAFAAASQGAIESIGTNLNGAASEIESANDGMNPAPAASGEENSVWVKNWGPNMVPPGPDSGVTTVNIFEGKLDYVDGKWIVDGPQIYLMSGGQPVIDPKTGLPELDPKLIAYIAACHKNGIEVKISLGGAGGQGAYNDTWDQLNSGNVAQVGQDLAAFCKEYGIDGIDFDYEEQKSDAQRALVGQLIGSFKSADPSLVVSVCTDAGNDSSGKYGWAADLSQIMDAAEKAYGGKNPVDRIYVMSYDYLLPGGSAGTEQADENFMLAWAQFAKTYGMSNNQVSVGIDPTDQLSAADREKLIQFAADNGFSTALWDQSDYNELGYTKSVYDTYWTEWHKHHPGQSEIQG